jgi:hypothetical protein
MALPEVLDDIAVHEQAHLIEPRHSRKSWLIVLPCYPDYAKRRAWLKENELVLRDSADTQMVATSDDMRET